MRIIRFNEPILVDDCSKRYSVLLTVKIQIFPYFPESNKSLTSATTHMKKIIHYLCAITFAPSPSRKDIVAFLIAAFLSKLPPPFVKAWGALTRFDFLSRPLFIQAGSLFATGAAGTIGLLILALFLSLLLNCAVGTGFGDSGLGETGLVSGTTGFGSGVFGIATGFGSGTFGLGNSTFGSGTAGFGNSTFGSGIAGFGSSVFGSAGFGGATGVGAATGFTSGTTGFSTGFGCGSTGFGLTSGIFGSGIFTASVSGFGSIALFPELLFPLNASNIDVQPRYFLFSKSK